MNVFFFPTYAFNPYIEHIISGLEANGAVIINKNATNKYQKLFASFSAMLHSTKIYHFNWIENKYVQGTFTNKVKSSFLLLWLKLMKKSGGKLVWTMHNRESHSIEGDKQFHHAFLRKLIGMMDLIVVHAQETRDLLINEYSYPADRICYLPHGSYVTGSDMPVQKKPDGKLAFLAFGMVFRYKNIPMLVRTFSDLHLPDATLYVCGKIDENDPTLETEMNEAMAGSENVVFSNAFVPEEEVDETFAKADLVVLPYDKTSMINSGAAIKAFSEGKPIIVSRFGAIKEIEDRSFVHSYDYADSAEHEIRIRDMLLQVYTSWKEDPTQFEKEGQAAFEYASQDLSWNRICHKLMNEYTRITEIR